MIRYTHICSGALRFEDIRNPLPKGDRRLHIPRGWDSEREKEDCPDCGDEALLRGAYVVVDL